VVFFVVVVVFLVVVVVVRGFLVVVVVVVVFFTVVVVVAGFFEVVVVVVVFLMVVVVVLVVAGVVGHACPPLMTVYWIVGHPVGQAMQAAVAVFVGVVGQQLVLQGRLIVAVLVTGTVQIFVSSGHATAGHDVGSTVVVAV